MFSHLNAVLAVFLDAAFRTGRQTVHHGDGQIWPERRDRRRKVCFAKLKKFILCLLWLINDLSVRREGDYRCNEQI